MADPQAGGLIRAQRPRLRDRDAAIVKALEDLRWGGVNIEHIPEEARALLQDAYTPEDHPALRAREKRKKPQQIIR